MSTLPLARDLHRLMSVLDAAAERVLRAEFGISHSQLAFLMPLLSADEVDVSTLAVTNEVSVPAISKRITWFTERGLVRTTRPAQDGRKVLLSLTPEGRALATRASARLGARLDELLADWPERRRTQLGTLVREVTTLIEDASHATAGALA